jgi:putative salt-induced outer membrane protein YdiY
MRYFLLIALLLFSFTVESQILNVESLRKVTDTSGWSGSASVNFALRRSTNDFFTIYSNIHVQYKMKKNLILFKNQIYFQKIEGENFTNSGVSHIRYNYRFHKRIACEVFVQGQYNKVSKIDFRGLVGTGPRFKLSNSENYKFYLGTLVMYEQEELSDGSEIQRNFRGSGYLSFSLYPTETITFLSTTYYQPRLSEISDFRISNQSSLAIDVFKGLAFTINYNFTYDKTPAEGIPNSQYYFTTGLSYSFD